MPLADARNPETMGGKPCVRGMRVTVGTIVGLVVLPPPRLRNTGGISLPGSVARRGDRSPTSCRMKLLIDMNLSPLWVQFLADSGFAGIHWSSIGRPSAPDSEIIDHASRNGLVVFTHDLRLRRASRASKGSPAQRDPNPRSGCNPFRYRRNRRSCLARQPHAP